MSDAIVTLSNPRSAAAEAFRTLRTNIEFSSVDEKLKTLLITSSAPMEDKSITVANLAVAMADGDRSVIVVDADLRRPRLHTLFDLPNETGFTTLFREEAAFENPPFHTIPGTSLRLLPSGPLPPIPSQLLTSKKMAAILNHLTTMAEIVLFDAPPVMAVNDASLLASKVDGVLLIVKANSSKRDYVKAAQDRLEKVNARLIGAVLTNAQIDSSLQYN